MKNILWFFLCVIVVLPTRSQQRTQLETDTFLKFTSSDKRLNDVYQQVLSIHKKDSVFTANLKTAQRLWIRFRDAQLSVRFPDTSRIQNNRSQLFYRTAYELRLIETRIKEL